MPENHSMKAVDGDATHDEVLILARVDKAKAIITTLPNDAENVFISLTARGLNGSVLIIHQRKNQLKW